MSAYKEFLEEKEKLDKLVSEGYRISGINENLSGAFLKFERLDSKGTEKKEISIFTADARKHFSAILIEQQRES
ncbi:hypothetical protein [Niallia sp. 01092]|uniref:hypothetical protein n=1 Tax=unclassified Niallia TaxID=2837522 RepID=UPI003FD06A00